MLAHGGGGHDAAGTCQVDNDDAASVLAGLAAAITADGRAHRFGGSERP